MKSNKHMIYTLTYRRWWYTTPVNIDKKKNKMSNCYTWIEPRIIDQGAKNVVVLFLDFL